MKTLTMQHSSPAHTMSWKLLPAILVALFSLCAFPSHAQTWTVGTGTSVYAQTATIPAPLGYYYPNARMQFLYDTASLRAAGMPVLGGPLTIHQIAFNVTSLQTAIPAANFSLGADQTAVTALAATGFWNGATGATQRFSAPSGYALQVGWNVINLSPALNWNGFDNIIIEVCYTTGTTAAGPGNAGVQYTATTGTIKSNYASGTGVAPYCGTPVGPTATLGYRPNIRFTKLFPCTGAPVPGTLTPSGTVSTLCPGTTTTIAASGYSNNLNTTFQWMTSSATTGPWLPIMGANSDRYTTPPLIANTYYHLVITCTNTGLKDSTANTGFTFTGGFPVYGALPYFEGFENWGNGCAISDKISSNNWTNSPATGNSSWRREDQAASAGWSNPTSAYPAAKEGLHSARWHGYQAPVGDGGSGVLQLYVNTSATAGNKDLTLYYYFIYATPQPTYPIDSIIVDYSTDGGATFNFFGGTVGKIGAATGPSGTWNLVTIQNIAVSSPTTVFRFRAKHGNAAGYVDDIFIDAVRIDPPCAGAPVAGTINAAPACSGKPFTLSLTGATVAAGLTYLWQYRAPGATFWNALPGGNVASPTATITAATEFRLILTCTNGTPNLSDTSAVATVPLAPFYFCYCIPTVSASYLPYGYLLVGNVAIKTVPAGVTLLNNGNPLPTISNAATYAGAFEDFRLTVPVPTLVRDSTYNIAITQTSNQTSWYPYGYGVAWIDFNRNGIFDNPAERILNKAITNQSNPTVNANFTIGSTSPTGLTGLLTMNSYYNATTGVLPCGQQYAYGQAEMYLVYIEYQPCSGPVNPGTTSASDTAVCPGYTVDLYNTTYEKTRTNILRMWEVSTNGGASFSAIPGSAQKDSMTVTITASSHYRLRVICGPTGDTTYSNTVAVRAPEPVRCYPVSWAMPGGSSDTSDVGAFIIGNFVNPVPSFPAGPHLLNPLARKRRSDFTLMPPIELNADSTYRLAIFQTMPGAFHADAMISVYMDFDNDLTYEQFATAPPFTSELVFQGKTDIDSFFLDTKIKIPSAVIPNVPTGMRVVLNNDVSSATAPGNSGSGVFTSGEVEDYIVIFRRAGLSAGSASLLQNLALYPNPTEGKFKVLSDAARAVAHLDVVVSTITGQQVLSRSFDNVGTHFSTDLDLSAQAKGIYFVEIRADGEKITKKLILR